MEQIELLRKEQIHKMYNVYVRHASSSSPDFNPVMRASELNNGNLRMYRFDEFEHIWVEVMMTLNVILAGR